VLAGLVVVALGGLSGCDRISQVFKGAGGGTSQGAAGAGGAAGSAGSAAGTAAGAGSGSAASGAEASAAVFAVNTTRAVKGQIRDYLALSGDIQAGTTVDAYSEVAGKVVKLHVGIGDRVNKDDPIAEVDPSRPGMTFVAGFAKAPISGTIVSLPAQVGMTITQAVPVARISGAGALELRTFVAERFISKMRPGLRADISLDAYPGQIFRGTVKELSPTVDPASRTMEVRLNVDNRDARLKPGMFAKIKIITQEKSGIVKIPANAVVRRFGEVYVFVAETDPADPALLVARRRAIVPGILIDDTLEVQDGLKAEEEIVVRGQTLLEEGSRVNVVERVAPLGAAD
jgi:multidrug efflux pump subunit AcrA (membrane-fusion protein)